jgi:signal transduction histidine kinase
MTPVWWLLLGLALGTLSMLPVLRLLLRRVEARARDAERRALEAERLAELGAMTSGLAHEIKNPLSTIGLNAQLLEEAVAESGLPEDEKARLIRRLEALGRETNRLGGILGDFLQFAGRIQLDPQRCDLVKLVDELADFYHPQCLDAGVVLRTQLPDTPVELSIDEGLLKQAILNLMVNATQAMRGMADDDHTAELILRLETDDAETHLHVTDTGPGIDAEKLDAIFHPYVSHRSGGTGLGLPTARRIVQEHGGRLEAVSEPGQGSEFVIHLPRPETAAGETKRRRDEET